MNPFERRLLWTTSVLTGLTGVVFWWMKNVLEPLDEFAVINHPLQPLVLKLHILVAPLLIFAIGLVASEHIWRHFRTGMMRARRTGLSTAGVIVPMITSGYLIQAITHVVLFRIIVWIHVGTGLLYLTGMLLHLVALRRTSARSRAAARATSPQLTPIPSSVPKLSRRTLELRRESR